MIIDSHCHLDYEPLNKNINDVLKRAENVGVKYFLTICTTDSSFEKILPILKKHKNVFGTYGIHPHEAKNHIALDVNNIKKKITKNEKIIGIGETGLDFYYNHSDKKTQKECFLKHIQASQETSKTLIVHSRSAEDDTFDILSNEIKNKKFVRKSFVAISNIKKNEILNSKNISLKRPGTGIQGNKWFKILNKKSSRSYKAGDLITEKI